MVRSARTLGYETLFGPSASGRALALRSSLAHRASPARRRSNTDARPKNIARCHGACALLACGRESATRRSGKARGPPRENPPRTERACARQTARGPRARLAHGARNGASASASATASASASERRALAKGTEGAPHVARRYRQRDPILSETRTIRRSHDFARKCLTRLWKPRRSPSENAWRRRRERDDERTGERFERRRAARGSPAFARAGCTPEHRKPP